MSRNKAIYTRVTNVSLCILWVGALTLLLIMLYNWRTKRSTRFESIVLPSKAKGIFVDQLLLSSQDLQLSENANLINLSLKRDSTVKMFEPDSIIGTAPQRKLIYSKILKSKINEISSAPRDDTDGFKIKPLPQ